MGTLKKKVKSGNYHIEVFSPGKKLLKTDSVLVKEKSKLKLEFYLGVSRMY